MAGRRSPS